MFASYDNFQKTLPRYFTSVRVRSVRENTAVVEEHLLLGRQELVMMTKHTVKYPETHETVVIGGDARGSRLFETFDDIPEGTALTLEADIKLRGMARITGIFAKNDLTVEFGKMVDEFVKVAES